MDGTLKYRSMVSGLIGLSFNVKINIKCLILNPKSNDTELQKIYFS